MLFEAARRKGPEMMKAAILHRSERLLATLLVLAAAALAAFALTAGSASAQTPEVRDFFGTIVSVGEGVIVVATDDGDVDVPIGAETDVRIPSEPDAGPDDLRVGDVVAVRVDVRNPTTAHAGLRNPTTARAGLRLAAIVGAKVATLLIDTVAIAVAFA